MEIIKKSDILYEDKDFVAVNKPAGLVVHDDGKQLAMTTNAKGKAVTAKKEPVLTDWVLKKYPKMKKVGEPIVMTNGTVIDRPGIVHRLDRGTSGVIVIAKNQKSYAALKEQFQARSVTKKYLAFVYGQFEDKYGTVNRPMGRSKNDFRKWSAQRGARGELRPAETWYTVLGSSLGLDDGTGRRSGNGYSYIEVEPKTGRTHQIRVHMKAINHPVVCDSLYAPERPCALGFGRTALHAHALTFHKMNGEAVTVTAPIPADFKKACKKLGIVIDYTNL
jgi:23S rRNA pseudouridine1911/1915/1917 synthase